MRYHHHRVRRPIRRAAVSHAGRAPAIMKSINQTLKLDSTICAAIVGNIMQESGCNPNARGSGGDYGLCQWTQGRRTRLIRTYPNSYNTEESQIKYLIWELQNTHAHALRAVKAPGSLAQKTVRFCNTFEVPNPRYAMINRRIAYATQALAAYQRIYGK
jgi:hypothetical protein